MYETKCRAYMYSRRYEHRINSWHTNGIKRCVTDESFYFAHEHPTSNIEYGYFNTTYNTFTIINHFNVTKHLDDSFVKHYS